jgi:hypothetical protein
MKTGPDNEYQDRGVKRMTEPVKKIIWVIREMNEIHQARCGTYGQRMGFSSDSILFFNSPRYSMLRSIHVESVYRYV